VELRIGSTVGGYVLQERLGSGGLSTVYRATDPRSSRQVALKVLHPARGSDPRSRERFTREVETLRRLDHPNIVTVLDHGQDGDLLWLAMWHISGSDLATEVRTRGPLTPSRALAILAEVAQALDHAHASGLVHGDVKPANVLLQTDATGAERAILSDFGVSGDLGLELTGAGAFTGTIAYAAPEQFEGKATGRTDVYSLGAVFFEMLTGRSAVEGENLAGLVWSVVAGPVPDVQRLRPDLPVDLARVVTRAMAKDPHDRFSSGAEMVAAARAALTGADSPPARPLLPPPSAFPPSPPAPPTSLGRGPATNPGFRLPPPPPPSSSATPSPPMRAQPLNPGFRTPAVGPPNHDHAEHDQPRYAQPPSDPRRQYRAPVIGPSLRNGQSSRGPTTDGGPLRPPPRLVSTGVGTCDATPAVVSPRTVLAADTAYRYWFAVGEEEFVGRADIGAYQFLPPVDVPAGARLRVVVFPFADGLILDPDADAGLLQFGAGGHLQVAEQPRGGPSDDRARLWFPFRTPSRPGTYRLRSAVYLDARLLQSRVLEVRVGRFQRPAWNQTITSVTDYSVTESLDAEVLTQMRPPKVSVLVNDSRGSHDFRFVGHDGSSNRSPLTGTATLDADALHALLDTARRALRRAAWGTGDEWREGDVDRYLEPRPRDDVAADLAAMARAGYRIWHALQTSLSAAIDGQSAASGGRERVDRLSRLLLRSGAIELASRHSLRIAVPSALIYDYPLDSNRESLRFCPTAEAAVFDSNRPLAAEPCFDGRCPHYDDVTVVCPGGFWGFRHELGVPLSLTSGHPGSARDMTSRIYGGAAPAFVVGSTTDPTFARRLDHLSRLQMLHSPMSWELGDSRDVVLDLLRMSSPHVVYFLCHGVEKDGLPGLVVGDPAHPYAITPDNLAAYRIAWPRTRPLVILNGCRTTALDPTKPINFVETFLQDTHASGVIGTEISVFEPLACDFAEEVLRRFVGDDMPLGRAVREARLALLQRGNPLGLAYVPYAPTELQMA
jgi:serine/threonine protein kinase